MKEFTGERVIPGQVDVDLWNEHQARYAFASRLASWKRVLEIACGSGYGTVQLAEEARSIVGLDLSPEAAAYANAHYSHPALRYLAASALALPFADRCFDLVVAYEVIEHLTEWRGLLAEARRVLSPTGQLIISTPNKLYYAESRKQDGPNPYHHHEFEFAEFRDALLEYFPNVSLFLQNHAGAIVFQPLAADTSSEVRVESTAAAPEEANFFLAVCAGVHQMGAPTFVYLPSSANVLKEREQHIARLEHELVLKDSWLANLKTEQQHMVELFREQKEALEASNRWSETVKAELTAAYESRDKLHSLLEAKDAELAAAHAHASEMAEGYERQIAAVQADNREKTVWATDLASQLAARTAEHQSALQSLQQAEATIDERSTWALTLDKEIQQLRDELTRIHDSRWIRFGRALHLGPGAQKS